MHARLTTFRVKPDRIEDLRRWSEEHQSEIYNQPGLRQWIGMIRQDGEAYVVAVFDDEQAARAALPAARALWSQFADMVEGEPSAKFLEVMGLKEH